MVAIGSYVMKATCDYAGCVAESVSISKHTAGAARNEFRIAGWEIITVVRDHRLVWASYCPNHVQRCLCKCKCVKCKEDPRADHSSYVHEDK